MNALGRLLLTLAVLLFLAIGVVLATVHPRFLLGTLVGDDAGYYLAIARNACLGHAFSFDRLNPTNGFNPLMPLLLIPLDRLLAPGYDLATCIRIAVLVSWIAVGLSLVALWRLGGRVFEAYGLRGATGSAATGALLFFTTGFVALKGYYGMDAFLVLAFALAYLASVAREGPLAAGAGKALRDGVLLGGAVLSRVDSLPLVVAAFLVMASVARPGSRDVPRVLARAAVLLAVIGPWLAWNLLVFGDWLPISARLKSSFPHWDPMGSLDAVLRTSLNPADEAALFLGLLTAVVWLVADLTGRLRPERDSPAHGARSAMGVLALYLAGRLIWLLLFSRLDVQGSYFVLVHPFLALAGLVLAVRVAGPRAALPAVAGVVLLGLALAGAKLKTALPEVRAIAAAQGDEWSIGRRIHDAVGSEDVLYGGAFGLVGFVADRAWINGDGVANDRAYQDAILRGETAAHLALAGVDYVVVAVSPPREPGTEPFAMTIVSHLHGALDSLRLDPTDIVLRERMRRNGGTDVWLVRWAPTRGGAPGVQASPGSGSPRQPAR